MASVLPLPKIWPVTQPKANSAGAVILEKDVSGLHHVEIVVGVIRHLDDPPSAQDAHAAAPRSLGRRMRCKPSAPR